MAGSDFTAFLTMIGKVVLWVLNRTLDLLALAFLVASCVLPWRLLENLNFFEYNDSWRWNAIVSEHGSSLSSSKFMCYLPSSRVLQGAFVMTLLDLVIFPLTLISLLSPFRWPRVYHVFKNYSKSRQWSAQVAFSPFSTCPPCLSTVVITI